MRKRRIVLGFRENLSGMVGDMGRIFVCVLRSIPSGWRG